VAAAPNTASTSTQLSIRFALKRKVNFGESFKLTGSHESLGNWDVSKSPSLTWSEGDIWTTDISLPPGTAAVFEFKCVLISESGGEPKWEKGPNHTIDITNSLAEGSNAVIEVAIDWSKGATVDGIAQKQSERKREEEEEEEYYRQLPAVQLDSNGSIKAEIRLPQDAWQGKAPVFMQKNEHSGERESQSVWHLDHLQGDALFLMTADKNAPSWLGKLDAVKELLVDRPHMMRPQLDALACSYIYLTWVATGALECAEGGGHRRPCAHADLSKMIFRSLEWVIGDEPGSPEALIARKMACRLPSFSGEYTQSTPLTRIRDIAHRNDIPSWLKSEIKHTIQNKLHRNAGPEDLVATEAMLSKITANPGEFPDAFISEFVTFLGELRDFFNAGSLIDIINAIRPSLDDSTKQVVDMFVRAKNVVDEAGVNANDNQLMDALHSATTVRAVIVAGLSSGMRNDVPDGVLSQRQRWRLAEIRLEDYVFVLLSRFENSIEARGGSKMLASAADGSWGLPIGAMVVGLRNLGLSGFALSECMALEFELTAWQKIGTFSESRDAALRMRATLMRLRRLAERYAQFQLDSFSTRADAMGRAVGLPEDQRAVFSEGEIRASVVFQLSKLAAILMDATTIIAGVNPWNVLVAGEAYGLLKEVARLEPGCLEDGIDGNTKYVLVVNEADGDEEVAALGPKLAGVLLKHEIPHLSHLGVRARQEKVPFGMCDAKEAINALVDPVMGKWVKMTALPDGLTLTESSPDAAGASATSRYKGGNGASSQKPAAGQTSATVVKTSSVAEIIPLQQAVDATCGAKAAACGELVRLADAYKKDFEKTNTLREGKNGSSKETVPSSFDQVFFQAPDGIVLPFGSMEAALKADVDKTKLSKYTGMIKELDILLAADDAQSSSAVDALCEDLRNIIMSATIPPATLKKIVASFDDAPKSSETIMLIARSSANVEDLAGFSAAGLYDSIPNLPLSSDNSTTVLESGIKGVWASLFSRRAVLARTAAGIPQGEAVMGVIVQRQLDPEVSFVLHTAHPLSGNKGVVVAELAPGLGETLASGTKGSGWRLEVDKTSAEVTTLAFANFSKALIKNNKSNRNDAVVVAPATALYSNSKSGSDDDDADKHGSVKSGAMKAMTIDYSKQELSQYEEVRVGVGRRLAAVGCLLETEFKCAQDVEGCLVGGKIWVVQTRPQPE